ncbi:M1-specific T cell receptor alpha chain-like [Pipra filicauda]|uniref:M1-specific T cell receptor alpha chain-like n=1 Tax=Pipra filicauda TaxID=649802 RepID=UPI0019399F66|nr:M1-specific T cell receptor alpha chain-like [Pipra filicauda]
MRRWRGAGLAALAAVLLVAAGRAQVQQEPLAQTPEGTEITINCSHPRIRTGDTVIWYRQLRGRGPQLLALILQGSKDLPDKAGQVAVSPDRRWSTLCLSGPRVGDAAVYYCAMVRPLSMCVTAALVFGKGTQLTVEPSSPKHSVPQVIVMKSKKLEEGGSTGKAACLARNFSTKNISLEMSSDEVVYEQSTPILASEGLYSAMKVVSVTKDTEVTCKAHLDIGTITALSEKEAEEPVTRTSNRVCNITDTSAQGTTVQRVNMLSVAVLGLRVLLAKSIAFNTLMSIKLVLF